MVICPGRSGYIPLPHLPLLLWNYFFLTELERAALGEAKLHPACMHVPALIAAVHWPLSHRSHPSRCLATYRGTVLVATPMLKRTVGEIFVASILDKTKQRRTEETTKGRPGVPAPVHHIPVWYHLKTFQLLNRMAFLHQGPLEFNQSAFKFLC